MRSRLTIRVQQRKRPSVTYEYCSQGSGDLLSSTVQRLYKMASRFSVLAVIAIGYMSILVIADNPKPKPKPNNNEENLPCGGPPDYAPCIPLNDANRRFRECCQDYDLPVGCLDLCKYDVTVTQLQTAAKQKKCGIENMVSYLYCASQNRDNRKCCEAIGLYKDAGPQCSRYCNPGDGIAAQRNDLTCAAHVEWIMRCHWTGLR